MKKNVRIVALFLFALALPARAEDFSSADFAELKNARYVPPRTDEAKESNKTYLELDNAVQEASKAVRRGQAPAHKFYTYTVKKDDLTGGKGLAQLAASLNQRQWTLALLNRIENVGDIVEGQRLVLSAAQGIFVPEAPATPLEVLVSQKFTRHVTEDTPRVSIDGKRYLFLAEMQFDGTIVAFFHDNGMVLPLSRKVVTSPFGYRTSPISGDWKMHNGIDLASPHGSEVFATKEGTVAETGFSDVYGNYIVISHPGNKTSLYAHLSRIDVGESQKVSTGETIGLVGTTGMSTGPHLHFEIHEGGTPKDPTSYLKK